MNDESTRPARDTAGPPALPARTTPTWEVELLISGIAVFAMLQLPGLLDDALFALRPRFDPAWRQPLVVMHMYFKATTVILAMTFAIHLLLRAQWIALVGMHSVYPDGVRWDRLRMGPIQRALEEASAGNAAIAIDRADNRATTVFATGVAFASILLLITLLIALLFGLAQAGLALAGLRLPPEHVFLACVFVTVLPMALATAVDRRFGARLQAGGLPHRILAALFRFFGAFGFNRGGNVVGLLSSHSGERRTSLLVMAILMPVMLGVMIGSKAAQSPERFGGYGAFPRLADLPARSVVDAHYDARRDVARDPAVPFVQDPWIAGPYLRLTVPFAPGDDDRAMRRQCRIRADDAPLRTIECLQSLHPASIDGKAVPALHYDAGTDPRTDRPALVAMIDVRALPPGRHELRVARAAHDEDEPADWIIPFWR